MAPHSEQDTPTPLQTRNGENSAVVQDHEELPFPNNAIDDQPKIKAIVIGAGLAGINCGVLLPRKVPGLELVIYDKNSDVGGTWHENIYPGVRCDVPAHVYQSTFAPNTQWTEKYATGSEIQRYWRSVAEKYDILKYIRLSHKVISASWNGESKLWEVEVEDLITREVKKDEGNVLITAVGHFNDWKLPDYSGIQEFEGHLRHSSNWDPNFDPKGKRIAVIGNGASGLQLVPQLQKLASHLDHYARQPTWVATSFAGPERKPEPEYFTPSELSLFSSSPSSYQAYRKSQESLFFRNFGIIFSNSPSNLSLRHQISTRMAERLQNKPELLKAIYPSFSPSCRRLTPGPGYLEALAEDNVSYITTPISHFTKSGIVDIDGTERGVDAVICCTGAKLNFTPFPISAGGVCLTDAWAPEHGGAKTYMGIAAAGFPNLFLVGSAQGLGYSGTVPLGTEHQVTYVAKVLRKLQSQGYASCIPTREAVEDFNEYADEFFKGTVFNEECSSWYKGGLKNGGRVTGLWPGSAWHSILARREPRWEDFEWERRSRNRFWWLGNGWAENEMEVARKVEKGVEAEGLAEGLADYLKERPEEIDLRGYHEEWYAGLKGQ